MAKTKSITVTVEQTISPEPYNSAKMSITQEIVLGDNDDPDKIRRSTIAVLSKTIDNSFDKNFPERPVRLLNHRS